MTLVMYATRSGKNERAFQADKQKKNLLWCDEALKESFQVTKIFIFQAAAKISTRQFLFHVAFSNLIQKLFQDEKYTTFLWWIDEVLVPSKEVSRIFLRAQYVSPDEAFSSHSFVLRRQTEFLALSQYFCQ